MAYTNNGLNSTWAGNLDQQYFDDLLFEDGTTYTATLLAVSSSSAATLTTVAGLQYFSTLAATAVGNALLVRVAAPVKAAVATTVVMLVRGPQHILIAVATNAAQLIKQPNHTLAAVASHAVSVKKTLFKTLKANATMLTWAFLHRCGVSSFSTIYAERNWNSFYHETGWSDTAEANWSYTVRQRIYGCS
jgi:hypothetical protein